MPHMMLRAVKITIGKGKSISAISGAMMTKPRLKMFAMPSDVTAKSVGNILGWQSQTAVKSPIVPTRAQETSKGN